MSPQVKVVQRVPRFRDLVKLDEDDNEDAHGDHVHSTPSSVLMERLDNEAVELLHWCLDKAGYHVQSCDSDVVGLVAVVVVAVVEKGLLFWWVGGRRGGIMWDSVLAGVCRSLRLRRD